jgi:hypothetical protein
MKKVTIKVDQPSKNAASALVDGHRATRAI